MAAQWRLGAERWYLTTWFWSPALLVRTGIEIGPPVLLSKIWIIRERALSWKEAKSLELCLGHSGYSVAVGQWWLLCYFYNKRTQKRGNFFKEEIKRQQYITLFYDADMSLFRVLDSSWLNWLGVTINSPCLPKGRSISGFSFALLGRLLPWKYKRCFILTTRIVSVSIKRHSPLPLLCAVSSEKTPHPLTWNTYLPSPAFGPVQLRSSVFCFLQQCPGQSRKWNWVGEKWPRQAFFPIGASPQDFGRRSVWLSL